MATTFRSALIPAHLRRSMEELSSDLELLAEPRGQGKRSAFWMMLVISAVIASAGVLGDSTATVIGAMIIAPLSTPIMGIALALVKRRRNGSVLLVAAGGLVVVLIGAAFSFSLPGAYDLSANSQIHARVSPALYDLIAAFATGLAGAVALARRDVAAVLPGVAIAISLVPPLAVVGVCLGRGQLLFASGAMLLFLSNLVAMVVSGVFVFAVLGYVDMASAAATTTSTRHRLALTVLVVGVAVPLALNTFVQYLVVGWKSDLHRVSEQWAAAVPGATITDVSLQGVTMRVDVRTPSDIPPAEDLLRRASDVLPDGLSLEIVTTVGEVIDAGTIGADAP